MCPPVNWPVVSALGRGQYETEERSITEPHAPGKSTPSSLAALSCEGQRSGGLPFADTANQIFSRSLLNKFSIGKGIMTMTLIIKKSLGERTVIANSVGQCPRFDLARSYHQPGIYDASHGFVPR
ncbi:hypothetical protein NP493_19g01004 [Ridgeia piscesae]|uniref:Uncharacterized protein n=1 Tax=Ridgeia piscesae TaxID=27915 RepID=A0AAD9PDP7_RIDPI|nr:hypothetical protein NP493_19g01004 [Ridgeia piscesae]